MKTTHTQTLKGVIGETLILKISLIMAHKDHWYDDETPIDFIVDQAIEQKFTYMTVTTITVYDDGHVTFEQ